MGLQLTFNAFDAGQPGSRAWTERSQKAWPFMKPIANDSTWTGDGQAEAMAMFARHMPELVPVHEALASALDQPGAAAFLTHATLKPFFAACSQTSVAGALLRNYDFDPEYCGRTIIRSDFLRPVIGMHEVFWGLLDGMNDAGLAVSLTFGGRYVHGPGMGALLVVRYLLETCTSVDEALKKLESLPVSTAQNLTLVDGSNAISVHVGPDMPATRAADICVTNHQLSPVPEKEEKITATQRRLGAVRAATAAAGHELDPVEAAVQALLSPPLYHPDYTAGLGTLYTAAYRPADGRVTYIWPSERWEQALGDFRPGTRTVTVG